MEPITLKKELEDVICPKCKKKIFVIGNVIEKKNLRVFEITCPLCKEGKIVYELTKPFRIFFEGDLCIDDWDYFKYVRLI